MSIAIAHTRCDDVRGEQVTPHVVRRYISTGPVEVLEDCVAIDVFTPVRQDWIDGTDTYVRRA